MYPTAVPHAAERICVYTRVRPSTSAAAGPAGYPALHVDVAHSTVHCTTHAGASPPTKSFSANPSHHDLSFNTSPARSPATTATTNTPTFSSDGAAEPFPRSPHPPPAQQPQRRRVAPPSLSFTFDAVMGDLPSAEVAACLSGTAEACAAEYLVEGKDVTVLCMGEEGSGKTSTMFGRGEEPGLCARLSHALFAALAAMGAGPATEPHAGVSFPPDNNDVRGEQTWVRHSVSVSCLLLQGERVMDLLAESSTHAVSSSTTITVEVGSTPVRAAPSPSPPLDAAPSTPSKPSITVDVHGAVNVRGVVQARCASAEDVLRCVGQARRAQASLNTSASTPSPSPSTSPSSPSSSGFGHVVVRMDVVVEEMSGGVLRSDDDNTQKSIAAATTTRSARLHLVDLASVRTTTTTTITPAAKAEPRPTTGASTPSRAEEVAVRQSLSVLRDVIVGLVESAARVRPSSASSRHTVHDSSTTNRHSSASLRPTAGAFLLSGGDCAEAPVTLPYRNSKLTTLLKGYLGGLCHTLVVAHVRSELEHQPHAIATLKLARQLLCVPEHATTHCVTDPAAQVRQLQRQVAALHADLRMQVELNKQNALRAAEAVRAALEARELSAFSAVAVATSSGAVVKTTPAVSLFVAGQGSKAASRSSNNSSAAQKKKKADKDAVQEEPHGGNAVPATFSAPALSPAAAALQSAVAEYIAGTISTLPITSVEDMNTCFELLRRQVAERDVRLTAALADLRVAQASAVAAAFWSAGAAQRGGTSRRSSSAGRTPSAGRERVRRASSMLRFPDNATTDGGHEGRRHSFQKRAADAMAAPALGDAGGSGRPYQTALLAEPSPTTVVASSGIGFGSAPAAAAPKVSTAAPPEASKAAATGTESGVPTSAEERPAGAFWLHSPNTNQVTWAGQTTDAPAIALSSVCSSADQSTAPSKSDTATDAPPFALPSTLPLRQNVPNVTTTPPRWQTDQNSTNNNGGGPSGADSLRRRTMPFSSPPPQPPWQSPPQREKSPTGRGRTASPRTPSASHTPTTATFPARTTAADAADVAPAKRNEAAAFDFYVAETEEGRRLLRFVRQEEMNVAALRHRPAGAAAAFDETVALESAVTVAEGRLSRRREGLLCGFEAWYRLPKTRGRAVTVMEAPTSLLEQQQQQFTPSPSSLLRSASALNRKGILGVSGGTAVVRPSSASIKRELCIPQLRLRPSSASAAAAAARSVSGTPPPHLSAAAAASIYRA